MALVIPKIIYNFNENSATTIRDYSENGSDGTGANLTIASSTRVGNDAVFNSATDQIDSGNITDFNGVADCALHFAINISAGAGTTTIFSKAGQLSITYNYTTNVLNIRLTVASGTITINSDALSTGTWYDFDFIYVGDVGTLYTDGVSTNSDATQSGVVATNSNTFYIGDNGTSASALFLLNEFKLFSEDISTDNVAAYIAEQNGVKITSNGLHGFALGDVIGSNINTGYETYGIVTFVESTTIYRIQPLTTGIVGGNRFQRVGHLWDTTRQWMFIVDDTPQICFYDLITKSSEVLSASKKTFCLDADGLKEPYKAKTANYTIQTNDSVIDATSGTFTVTLPTASAVAGKLYYIKNSGTGTLTLDTTSSQTMDGVLTNTLIQASCITVLSNGANWIILNRI